MARGKKEIAFTEIGMRQFSNVNDAYKYYSNEVSVKRSRRAVVELFQNTYELNIGPLSLNMAAFDASPVEVKKLLEGYKPLGSIKGQEKLKMSIETWKRKFDTKVADETEAIKKQIAEKKLAENVEQKSV